MTEIAEEDVKYLVDCSVIIDSLPESTTKHIVADVNQILLKNDAIIKELEEIANNDESVKKNSDKIARSSRELSTNIQQIARLYSEMERNHIKKIE